MYYDGINAIINGCLMRYKVVVSYNGAKYCGWQTQHRGDSVQEAIETILSAMHREAIEIVASGRTDAKVHAMGQVFHFDSNLNMSCKAVKTALNSQIPKDIRIIDVEIVEDDFHARFHAISKRYDYYLTNEMENPFVDDFMAKYYGQLNLEDMKECAKIFLGEHDFTSFTSAKIDPRKSRVKTITRFDVVEEGNVVHFILEGNGFLRYMVRMLVQTVIEVGKGKITTLDAKKMLEGKDKHLCRFKAPAQGLYLVKVDYEGR